MDPKKLASLDPKLRAAYERVMGTVIPEPQTPPVSPSQGEPVHTQTPPSSTPTAFDTTQQANPQPNLAPAPNTGFDVKPQDSAFKETPQEPFSVPPQSIPPTPESTVTDQPITNPQPQTSQEQPSNFVQMNSEVPAVSATTVPNFTTPAPQAQVQSSKKKSGIVMPILFGIVGLIFIVIYTLFWTKIFNFKLPFLP